MPHKGARKFVHPIPADWLPHDGKTLPVAAYSHPGVAMRDGSQSRVNGMEAVIWHTFAEGSCWEWADREPRDSDIIAYTPGTVEPLSPRLCRGTAEDHPCALPRGHSGPCDSFVVVPVLSYDQSGR